MAVRLFHLDKNFVKTQDLLLVWGYSSIKQLPASLRTYSFVFIREKLRLFELVRLNDQLLFGNTANQFKSNRSLYRYFSHRHLGISVYSFLNQLWLFFVVKLLEFLYCFQKPLDDAIEQSHTYDESPKSFSVCLPSN